MTCSSPRSQTTIKTEPLAILFVTSLPLVYFNAALRGAVVLTSDDGILFNVPMRIVAANMVRAGSLPLWNPYIFGGMPLHAAAQGGLLFPLNWFFLFFNPVAATNLMTLSTYMLAALGAYLYARRSGSSLAGAVLTSVIWQWCGFLIGQYSHVNIVQTAVLLPWLLWAIDGFGERGDRRWAIVIAAIVMFQAFTGHQQTLVYSLMLATAYAVVMWRVRRPERNFYVRSLVLLPAGMLLAAVQILPTYELMRNSLRSESSLAFFTSFSLPPKFVFTFFAPYLFGGGDGRLFRVSYLGPPFYGEFIGYVSVGAIMLAGIAVVLTWKDPRTKFWATVAVSAFARAVGGYWPLKLYGLIYYVPILNLFRVPARHIMEVNLALAVLAGRGLTALRVSTDRKRMRRVASAVGVALLVLTCLAVTMERSSEFRLARNAPVSLLRAPELFLPILFAGLSAWALWRVAVYPSAFRVCLVIALIAIDLCLWGQFSGWRVGSPSPNDSYWTGPPPAKYLPKPASGETASYRILTASHPFDPSREVVGPTTSRSNVFHLWLQPDLYSINGIENAAGYDGFGLARFSRLARDMTVWGELPHPDASLRGEGRELDILNVRYLLALSDGIANVPSINSERTANSSEAVAMQVYGGERFAETNLELPNLRGGHQLFFTLNGIQADRIALLTNLSWATQVPTGTKISRVRVSTQNGKMFEFDILAGRDTAEWAYDRRDIKTAIRHKRANVGTSYLVTDEAGNYEAHTYVTSFSLPARVVVTRVEVIADQVSSAPDLLLSVVRVSLVDSVSGVAIPLRREWASNKSSQGAVSDGNGRWQRRSDRDGVVIYENQHALARAWLAPSARVLDEQQIITTIHNGTFPSGEAWDPKRIALVESSVSITDAPTTVEGNAEVIRNDPTKVEVHTVSSGPSILVLSANHYPGWRAYIDGGAVETLRVNYNLRGVVLPAGEHRVEFVYRPKSVLIGFLVSLLTAAALIVWFRIRRRQLTSESRIRTQSACAEV